MFAKLLKHDFHAVFKYWWIGAVISVGIAVLGGFAGRIAFIGDTKYDAITDLSTIIFVFALWVIIMLPLFTQIILLVRYQRHFFSDEGYLTFTLPVKKTTLIESKFMVSFVFSVFSYLVVILNFVIIDMICVDFGLSEELSLDFSIWCENMGGYALPYAIIIILILFTLILCSNVLIFACVTFASAIVKKYKVLAGLGVYTGVTSIVFSIVRVIVVSLSFSEYDSSAQELMDLFTVDTGFAILLGILGILIAVFGALYFAITVILNKKLNLS